MIDRHIHTAINPSDVYPVPGCDECRLMAAAPDLLAALEAAYVGLRDAQTSVRGTFERLDAIGMQTFAALAKARGE